MYRPFSTTTPPVSCIHNTCKSSFVYGPVDRVLSLSQQVFQMLVYRGTLSSALGVTVANQCAIMILPTSIGLGEPIMFYYQLLVPAPPLSPIVGNLGRIDVVSTTTISKGSASFGFLHGNNNSWQFDATYAEQDPSLTQNPPSITLVVTQGDNKSPSMIFDRVFSDPDFTRIAFAAVPHIYVGKLTWPNLNASSEMFIVIIPESINIGNPICVYRQWTTPQEISQVNYEGKIISAKGIQNAIVITFSYLDYTFTGSIDEASKTISVIMSDTSGNVSQPPFLLSDKFQVPFDAVDGRAKRSAIDKTSTVLNNGNDVIFCEVSSSSEALVGKIMAGLGSLIAVGGAVSASAGLLAGSTAAVTLANPVGAAVIAGAGLLLAIASVADVLPVFDPKAPQGQVLFPGESIIRTSSGGAGASNNNVLAVKAKIQGDDLVISMAQKSAIGDGTCNLEDLFLQGGTSVTELLRISLRALQAALSACQRDVAGDTPVPRSVKLIFYRLIAVKGLEPLWDFQQGQPITESQVVGSVFSSSTPQLDDNNTPKWYGSFTSAEIAQDIFSCESSTAFTVFTQTMGTSRVVSTAGVAYEIKQTPGGKLVLRLDGCSIDFTGVDKEDYAFPLKESNLGGRAEPVEGMLSLIDNYQGYWAFSSFLETVDTSESPNSIKPGGRGKVQLIVTKVMGLRNGAFRIKKNLEGSIYFLIKQTPQIVQFLGY